MADYYGKVLPGVFADGYIHSFHATLGYPTTQALQQHAAQVQVAEPAERLQWLAPLHHHLTEGTIKQQPLDYALLSLFHAGLMHGFPLKTVLRLSERIGMHWWLGDPPVSTHRNINSLSNLFALSIGEILDAQKRGGASFHQPSLNIPGGLAQQGILAFVDSIQQKSSLIWRIKDEPVQIILSLEECPFCIGYTETCHVWWGVFQSLVDWLHGTHHDNAVRNLLVINREQSTSHQLVLTKVDSKPKGRS